MLPFEADVRQEIETTASTELTESRDLLLYALNILGCDGSGSLKVPATPVLGVGNWARSLALGLYSKACKQFRTIVLVGEAGFGGEMMVLTRALFETLLALEFLMKEVVVLKREGNKIEIDPSRPLTTDFRAQLYGARVALMAEKRLKDWGERSELKDSMAILGDSAKIAAQAVAAKSAVGEVWWKALKRGPAGLSVKDLAESLGLPAYYVMIYGDQSEVAHAGDAFRHFDVADDGTNDTLDLSPSSEGIGRSLRLANLVFLSCLVSIHNRLQFGETVEMALNEFAERRGVPTNQ